MASVVLVLDQRRAKKDGSYPIIIRLTHGGKSLPIKTGYDGMPGRGEFKVKDHTVKVKNELQERLLKIKKYLADHKAIIDTLDIHKVRQLCEAVTLNNESELKTDTISEAITSYLAYLRNEGVPEHKVKNRTEDHIKDIERVLRFLSEILGPDTLISAIGERQAGQFYTAVINKKSRSGEKIRSRRYNFHIQTVKTFFDWLKIDHPFKDMSLKELSYQPVMLTLDEFKQVLDNVLKGKDSQDITYFIDKSGKKKKKTRYYYRPFLYDAFRLALYGGGRRREELVSLRWSDVHPNEYTGQLVGGLLRYRNLKVERQEGIVFTDQHKIIDIPIIPQLADLLFELGYGKKDPESFVLAPEISNRYRLMDDLSRSFTHYYGLIPSPRPGITFKSMRKTYITFTRTILGSLAKTITGHTNDRTIDTHYQDPSEIRKEVVEKLKF